MAATVVRSPEAFGIASKAYWEFSQTQAPAFGTRLFFYYRLYHVGVGYVEQTRRLVKYTGQNIPCDYSKVIEGILSNQVKSITDDTDDPDNMMTANFYVEYGEISYTANGGSSVDQISQTDQVKVVKAKHIGYGVDFITPSPPIVISNPVIYTRKPPLIRLNKDTQSDWIYFGGGQVSAAAINYIAYNVNGIEMLRGNKVVTSGVVSAFPIGPVNFYGAAGLTVPWVGKVVFTVGTFFNGFTDGLADLINETKYTVLYESCGGQPEQEVIFLEPSGGYSSIWFEKIKYKGNRSSGSYQQYRGNGPSYPDDNLRGGLTDFSVKTFMQYDLEHEYSQASLLAKDYFMGLLSSKYVLTKTKDVMGSIVYVKMKVLSASIDVASRPGKTILKISLRTAKYFSE